MKRHTCAKLNLVLGLWHSHSKALKKGVNLGLTINSLFREAIVQNPGSKSVAVSVNDVLCSYRGMDYDEET